jgi:hypothetical protein
VTLPYKKGAREAAFSSQLAIFVHILRYLKMVLLGREDLARPVLQLRIATTLSIPFEERSRVLMRTDLHRIVFRREVFRLDILQLVEFFLRSSAIGMAACMSPENMPLSSWLIVLADD